jgi:hypothetical protein
VRRQRGHHRAFRRRSAALPEWNRSECNPHRHRGVSPTRGTDVNIKPVARSAAAIQVFHDLGFRTLGHVQLFISLNREDSYWRPRPSLHGRAIDC